MKIVIRWGYISCIYKLFWESFNLIRFEIFWILKWIIIGMERNLFRSLYWYIYIKKKGEKKEVKI